MRSRGLVAILSFAVAGCASASPAGDAAHTPKKGGPPATENLPPGAVPVAAFVSQIVTDWPGETHVFVSMLHNRAPVYVDTRRGVWLVVGDKITLVDDKPPPDR